MIYILYNISILYKRVANSSSSNQSLQSSTSLETKSVCHSRSLSLVDPRRVVVVDLLEFNKAVFTHLECRTNGEKRPYVLALLVGAL